MSQIKRPQFLGFATIAAGAIPASYPTAQTIGRIHNHDHDLLDGPLASATVSFGA